MLINLLVILSMLWPVQAFGWGAAGHTIVAELAERHLSKEARLAMVEFLGPSSLASVANLADTWARQDTSMRSWHYVNVPYAAEGYDPVRDCDDLTTSYCLPERLIVAVETLQNKTLDYEARRRALILMVHLIADAHQPLHCAQRGDDHGGLDVIVNDVESSVPLHIWWDVNLLERNGYDWGYEVDRLQQDPGLPAHARAASPMTVPLWINECHALARTVAYDYPQDGRLDDAYRNRAGETADRQLTRAAARLAATLETLTH